MDKAENSSIEQSKQLIAQIKQQIEISKKLISYSIRVVEQTNDLIQKQRGYK